MRREKRGGEYPLNVRGLTGVGLALDRIVGGVDSGRWMGDGDMVEIEKK